MERREIGLAVVGSGRMGLRRASLAAMHPSVSFIAVSDADPERSKALAQKVGAQHWSGDNRDVIERPEVDAVIVSTSEREHLEPVLMAIDAGKPVLVEKPMATTTADAERMIAAAEARGVELRVAYSRRFKRNYLIAKEQIADGRLGKVLGAMSRAYNGRAHHSQVLKRSPHASAVLAGLTYYVDIINWFLEGNQPVEVIARGQQGFFKESGHDVDDLTWAIVTYADGAVANLGINYALPAGYPLFGPSERMEVLGSDGVVLIDHDNSNQILYTDKGLAHSYVPDHDTKMAYLSSSSTGDWALGDFWGPVADETRTWIDHLVTGRPCSLATASEARTTLGITLAIEHAAKTRETVSLPFEVDG